MPSYFRSTLNKLLETDQDQILGQLAAGIEADKFYQLKTESIRTWQSELPVIVDAVRDIIAQEPSAGDWSLLLEYPIPRRGRRVDAVVLAGGLIISLEFKMGAESFNAADRRQAIGYCLDLRDFHEKSRDRLLIPLLMASHASVEECGPTGQQSDDAVQPLWLSNGDLLGTTIVNVYRQYNRADISSLDATDWDNSIYHPTPTIVEAAQTLYAHQDVREISRSEAGATNLTITSDAAIETIEYAKKQSRKVICFITGVPGSGKTLAGLNIVHNPKLQAGHEPIGAFMSGNGPLVRVLTEALARDHHSSQDCTLEEARRKVSTFIQNIHLYIKEYVDNQPDVPPIDHVIIFDEAQRAWDAAQNLRKWKRNASEPSIILSTMNRHKDWAVIVALIGNGQEIYDGEAGLPEWGNALTTEYRHWEVIVSPHLKLPGKEDGPLPLFLVDPEGLTVKEDSRFHLKVAIRSYKAEAVDGWVEAILHGNSSESQRIMGQLFDKYPIVMTRSLDTAKRWLREKCLGDRRCGIVASSAERRLRPHALDVTVELPVEQWFLNPPEDIRSSSFLELAATEFAIQGLELDWACVCWGADMRFKQPGSWEFFNFSGTKWQTVRNERQQGFALNKYRVLLTRAREGMVIWVPPGSTEDPTRNPAFYDGTAEYLQACGLKMIS